MNGRGRRSGAKSARVQALVVGGLALSGLSALSVQGQTLSAVPDAQVEANVLKALATAPELSTQDIQSSTVYGVVTLSGTVQTEALRTRAENLVARATGVKKVLDEMALGTPAQANTGASGDAPAQENGSEPVLQSDGSYAPPPPPQPATPYQGPPAAQDNEAGIYGAQPSTPSQPSVAAAYPPQPGYSAQGGPNQQSSGPGTYEQPGSSGYGQRQPYPAPGYSQPQGYPGQQGYAPPPQAYSQPGYSQPGYAPLQGGQQPGLAVTVPAGALLRVRINRGLDSNHLQPGTPFDGTVLSDVTGSGAVAIPRGAAVQGVVVDAKKAGALKGEGELALQINSVTLAGSSYPVVSDLWEREGRDKSVRTVNSAVGLGVLGAIAGGVAGGGAGAAVGAGVGAGVGVAGSAASPGGRVIVPPEAVLTFHLAQPAEVRTVSEQEMQRLAYAAGPGGQVPTGQPVVRRRYYNPYYAPYPYYPYR